VTDAQKGVLAAVVLMIIVVMAGILTDWGAGAEPRVPIRQLIQERPHRPPHPASIYTPPGWEKSP
jgi:hypothetical protein